MNKLPPIFFGYLTAAGLFAWDIFYLNGFSWESVVLVVIVVVVLLMQS